jgi:hypothetical protein
MKNLKLGSSIKDVKHVTQSKIEYIEKPFITFIIGTKVIKRRLKIEAFSNWPLVTFRYNNEFYKVDEKMETM